MKDLQRNRSRYQNARQAKDELHDIAAMGFGTFERREAEGGKGGRPSEVFVLGDQYREGMPPLRLVAPQQAAVEGAA